MRRNKVRDGVVGEGEGVNLKLLRRSNSSVRSKLSFKKEFKTNEFRMCYWKSRQIFEKEVDEV